MSHNVSNEELTLDAEGLDSGEFDDASAALEPALQRGNGIGRYTLLTQIGRGGMGVIWSAYDPELDRKIALKVLLVDTEASRTRLLREAQALAKLAHPNVVTVHDVGSQGDQVWIAMEYIDGETLREWLGGQRRDWRAIRAVMLEAGRGLAAAHRKGLIHRDFKPENVMIDRDGRVRVMDFGLVRSEDGPKEEPDADWDEEVAEGPAQDPEAELGDGVPVRRETEISKPLDTDITRGGAIMGTPAYMAPEQHLGVETDARTDQFGFCVTLWEALHGARPFHGRSLATLAVAVCEGRLDAPPADAAVPSWLRRAVERGLSPGRHDRYESMDALLEALSEDPRRRWWRGLIVGLGLGLILAAWGASALAERRARRACVDEGAAIEQIWSPAQAVELEAAFGATGSSLSGDSWARTQASVNAWTKDWAAQRSSACVEAELDETRSASSIASARDCFDQQAVALSELLAALAEVDRASIHNAALSAMALPQPASCVDEQRVQTMVADDPRVGERGPQLRRELLRSDALESLGRYEEARALALAAREGARELAWPPLEALAGLGLGRAQARLGDYAQAEATLEQAFFLAGRGDDDELMARAAVELSQVVGDYEARHGEGLRWARLAELHLARAQLSDSPEAARLETIRGRVHRLAGSYDEAVASFARAREILAATLGPSHPRVADVLNSAGNLDYTRGNYKLALELYGEALAIYERTLGADHPKVAAVLNNMGNALRAVGEAGKAEQAYLRSLAIREAVFGPDHPDVGTSLSNLGTVYISTRRLDEGLEVTRRALAIREAALGPKHPRVGTTLNNLGELHRLRGEPELALELFERALAIREAALGPDHSRLGTPLNNIGEVHASMGDHAEARAAYERALAIYEQALGADHHQVAKTLRNIAWTHREEARYAEAEALLARALEIERGEFGPDSVHVGYVELDLGRVDEDQGRLDAARVHYEAGLRRLEGWDDAPALALALARWDLARVTDDRERASELRDQLALLGEDDRVAEIEAWLASGQGREPG